MSGRLSALYHIQYNDCIAPLICSGFLSRSPALTLGVCLCVYFNVQNEQQDGIVQIMMLLTKTEHKTMNMAWHGHDYHFVHYMPGTIVYMCT